MSLTPAQLQTLKTAILAETDPTFVQYRTEGNNAGMAIFYNEIASPTWTVWKTSVKEHDITGQTSPEGTVWSWPAYIARSIQEQNGWMRMFNTSLTINPSLPQVRQGIQDIFSGSQNSAPAHRTHISAMSKRSANRVEKLFSTGTGSVATPATMTFEGELGSDDIRNALAS